MTVALIKYNAGNVQSVVYALQRLGIEPVYTDDEETLRKADKVIFPGVGEASSTMKYLRATGLDRIIPTLKQPFLGTCIGMQLMCRHSEENDTACLGIFDIDVKRFQSRTHKVPHVGWNTLSGFNDPLLAGIPDQAYVYYVHSYYAELGPYTLAQTDYAQPFSAVLRKDNFYAAQFHAEISGKVGSRMLANFLGLD